MMETGWDRRLATQRRRAVVLDRILWRWCGLVGLGLALAMWSIL